MKEKDDNLTVLAVDATSRDEDTVSTLSENTNINDQRSSTAFMQQVIAEPVASAERLDLTIEEMEDIMFAGLIAYFPQRAIEGILNSILKIPDLSKLIVSYLSSSDLEPYSSSTPVIDFDFYRPLIANLSEKFLWTYGEIVNDLVKEKEEEDAAILDALKNLASPNLDEMLQNYSELAGVNNDNYEAVVDFG